jgi:hypothetical protein
VTDAAVTLTISSCQVSWQVCHTVISVSARHTGQTAAVADHIPCGQHSLTAVLPASSVTCLVVIRFDVFRINLTQGQFLY